MNKIVVTGGLGFIGSNLIELLLEKNFYVINIDNCGYASSSYKFNPFLLPIFGEIIPLNDIDETFCDFLKKERKPI